MGSTGSDWAGRTAEFGEYIDPVRQAPGVSQRGWEMR